MTSPYVVGESMTAAKMYARIEARLALLEVFSVDTGWVTCTVNSSFSGTAKVRRIGSQVFGQISITSASAWPNSAFTFFTLPDTTWAPVSTHRMSGGGPNQATAGQINLTGTPGSTAVSGGATGSAGSAFYWSGSLWLVN